MSDDSDNLIEVHFKATRDDLPIRHRRSPFSSNFADDCKHRRTSVDVPERKIRCRDCGDVLDPFAVVADMAVWAEHSLRITENMRGERERIAADVERLKKERRNLRAQNRRRK